MDASLKDSSLGLEVFFSKLAESISNPEQLAADLYSQGVISKEIHQKAINGSSHDMAARLVATVKTRILEHRSVLDTFLSILREHPSLVCLANALSDFSCKCRL